MKYYSYLVCTILFLLFVTTKTIAKDNHLKVKTAYINTTLGNLPITMELVDNKNNKTPTIWPTQNISLDVFTKKIRKKDEINKLLKKEGINPDLESYSLICELNEDLKFDQFSGETVIKLPKIKGISKIRRKLRNGYIVLLTIDKPLKDQLLNNIRIIEELAKKALELNPNRFSAPQLKPKFNNNLEGLVENFGVVKEVLPRRIGIVLRYETYYFLAKEADQLKSTLEEILDSARQLLPSDIEQISNLYEDIKVERKKYNEIMGNNFFILVDLSFCIRVKIKGKEKDKERIENLRVFYIVNGMYKEPLTGPPPIAYRNFGTLGNSSGKLQMRHYRLWAAPADDPLHPVTEVFRLDAENVKENYTIELSLIK